MGITAQYKIKTVLIDIDGTLLRDKGGINVKNLKKCFRQKSDLVFGIATARPFSTSVKIYRQLGITGPLLCENGGIIFYNFWGLLLPVHVSCEDFLVSRFALIALRISFLSNRGRLSAGSFYPRSGRYFSLSLYPDNSLTGKIITEKLHDFTIKWFTNWETESFQGRKIIFYNKGTIKAKFAVLFLSNRHKKILLISDTEKIYPSKDIFYASLGNSDISYRRSSNFSTEKIGNPGIIDILNRISNGN